MSTALEKIVGKENLLSRKADKEVYAADASQIEGKATVIVLPESIEQVHKIVRFAVRTNSNLVVRGAGTGLAGGSVPQDSIVLDLSKLNKIVKINFKNKTAIVETGVILDDLNYKLEGELLFPIRPSSHAVCTIGGMIATDAAGNNAIKFGNTSKWVEEIEVIDGTGKMFKIKGEDLNKFAGKEGTTGIIVKAKLKLTKPLKYRTLDYHMIGDAKKLMRAVKKYKENPKVIGIEYFNRISAKIAGLDEKNHLFIEFASEEGSIKEPKEIDKIWALRDGMGPICSADGRIVMEDPRIPKDKIPEFIEWTEKNELPCFGHIGLGIFHPRFKMDQEKLIKEMFKFVKEIGGDVSGEHGIGLNKKE